MTDKTFLLEIGTEELPPKALRKLAEAFAASFTAELAAAQLTHGEVNWFATPRRLALKVAQLSSAQPEREDIKRGPAIAAAYDAHGVATKAAEGWARGCGITLDQAERQLTEKGEWLIYRARSRGKRAEALLPAMVEHALAKLPIPRLMRWGDNPAQFVRPVHTVTLLYGGDVVPATLFGVASGRTLPGHRFMGEATLVLDHADDYPSILLQRGKVVADFHVRQAQIKSDVQAAAKKLGGRADICESLLEEVTSLVEWPVVLTASFEKKFLSVPAEALVSTMKGDQKYFPVYDQQGGLMPHFIFVSNIASKDPQQIIVGNAKVVRPRLADAEFFFNTDRQQPLAAYLPQLEQVMFQQQLGTLREKTVRLQSLAVWVADRIDANATHAARAALLSKCDLMTSMVFEFTDTQGVMGMHYARADGEAEEVALALKEQYQPRYAGDRLPSTPVACALAIADKIDTLVGIFAIGQQPKGDKDPFALRRAALGVLRIIVEKQLPLDLQTLAQEAARLYGGKIPHDQLVDEVTDFMLGRFRRWYLDQGYRIDTLQAVLARRPTRPADFDARMRAVTWFRRLPEAVALAAANKRVSNILAKSPSPQHQTLQASLLKENAEIKLATFVTALQSKLSPYFAAGRYQDALIELAHLREPTDNFFDHVRVNADDQMVRTNRLTLLACLRELFLQVADISLLQQEVDDTE